MSRIRTTLAGLALTLLLLSPVAALADITPPPPEEPPEETVDYDREDLSREGFVAAEDTAGESVPSGTYLIIAYALFWTFVLLYVIALVRRHRTVASELNDLTKRIDEIDDRLEDAGM